MGNGEANMGNGEANMGNGEANMGNGEANMGNGEANMGFNPLYGNLRFHDWFHDRFNKREQRIDDDWHMWNILRSDFFFGRLPTLTQILLSGVDNHQLETNEGKFTWEPWGGEKMEVNGANHCRR